MGPHGGLHKLEKRRITCDAMAQLGVRHLDDLLVFLRAVERGGFSQAARELHRTPRAVSKQVARLEGALGVRLFERSTRSMRVTDEGRAHSAGGALTTGEAEDSGAEAIDGFERWGRSFRRDEAPGYGNADAGVCFAE